MIRDSDGQPPIAQALTTIVRAVRRTMCQHG